MLSNIFANSGFLAFGGAAAQRQVAAEPGVIVGPIARLFGFIMNWSFNVVYSFTTANSLGLAIILLTTIVFLLMLPLNLRSQRSMTKVQQLRPKEQEIRKKYEGVTDKEKQKKMQEEIFTMYSQNGANPMGGFLPMLVQMPLFFGLFFIMNNVFLYIGVLNGLYYDISISLHNVPAEVRYVNYVDDFGHSGQTRTYVPWHLDVITPIARPLIPDRWQENAVELHHLVAGGMDPVLAENQVGEFINLNRPEHLARVLNRFTAEEWDYIFSRLPEGYDGPVRVMYEEKMQIVNFAGLNLLQASGWAFPGIIIPFLAALTSLASSFLGRNQTPQAAGNSMMANQTIMMIVMPVFMGFITVNLPAGVGIYWIVQNVYRVAQQVVSAKRAGLPLLASAK